MKIIYFVKILQRHVLLLILVPLLLAAVVFFRSEEQRLNSSHIQKSRMPSSA